jgi:hypothetical protein
MAILRKPRGKRRYAAQNRFRAFDGTDSNFALAMSAPESYAPCHVHQLTEDRAELLLSRLRTCVFWRGEAEPLGVAFSPKESQPTTRSSGRWVFHFGS